MELNAEINKVFGMEMAKLFADTISEEQLKKKALDIWADMNRATSNNWNHRSESEIEKYIKEVILKKLYDKIGEILKEPINEELLEKKAREMVETARKVGEEAIIKDMASHMVNNALSIHGRDDAIIASVINELRIMDNNKRMY